ncbi:hypothetical protein [Streptomyces sp. ISL-94]|uniref:hypothetical protein n=1 Tax=Streptomyces sp. ISL-94 TaxID=2819190 RepID=UPI002034E29C|nr:hypothetical protein [Streptomyces sp. ISL-94]
MENLAEAAPAAAGWAPGAYNVADGEPYARDEAVRRVLRAHGSRARIGHLPQPVARTAARAAEALARGTGREPALSRYAVDQPAHPVVLDLSRARARGWAPRRTLSDYLGSVAPGGAPVQP